MKAIRYIIIMSTFLWAGMQHTHAQTDPSSIPLGEELLNSKGRIITTRKLIESHATINSVPIDVKLQKVAPSLYTLSIPIEVSNAVEEYPEGRELAFQDNRGNIILQAINGVSVNPTLYLDEDQESNQFFSYRIHSYDVFEVGNPNDSYFCHPRFILTEEQLNLLYKKGNSIQRIVVTKADGNSFWFYYPTSKFQKEMGKIITKMAKH